MSTICYNVLNHIVEYIPTDVSYLNGFNLSSKSMNKKLQPTVNAIYWNVIEGCGSSREPVRKHYHNNRHLCQTYIESYTKPNKKHRRCGICRNLGHNRTTCPTKHGRLLYLCIGLMQHSQLQINCLLDMITRWNKVVVTIQPEEIQLDLIHSSDEKVNSHFLERLSNMLMNTRQQPFKQIRFKNWFPKYDEFIRFIEIFNTNTILQPPSLLVEINRWNSKLEQYILNMLLSIKNYTFSIKLKKWKRWPGLGTRLIIKQIRMVSK